MVFKTLIHTSAALLSTVFMVHSAKMDAPDPLFHDVRTPAPQPAAQTTPYDALSKILGVYQGGREDFLSDDEGEPARLQQQAQELDTAWQNLVPPSKREAAYNALKKLGAYIEKSAQEEFYWHMVTLSPFGAILENSISYIKNQPGFLKRALSHHQYDVQSLHQHAIDRIQNKNAFFEHWFAALTYFNSITHEKTSFIYGPLAFMHSVLFNPDTYLRPNSGDPRFVYAAKILEALGKISVGYSSNVRDFSQYMNYIVRTYGVSELNQWVENWSPIFKLSENPSLSQCIIDLDFSLQLQVKDFFDIFSSFVPSAQISSYMPFGFVCWVSTQSHSLHSLQQRRDDLSFFAAHLSDLVNHGTEFCEAVLSLPDGLREKAREHWGLLTPIIERQKQLPYNQGVSIRLFKDFCTLYQNTTIEAVTDWEQVVLDSMLRKFPEANDFVSFFWALKNLVSNSIPTALMARAEFLMIPDQNIGSYRDLIRELSKIPAEKERVVIASFVKELRSFYEVEQSRLTAGDRAELNRSSLSAFIPAIYNTVPERRREKLDLLKGFMRKMQENIQQEAPLDFFTLLNNPGACLYSKLSKMDSTEAERYLANIECFYRAQPTTNLFFIRHALADVPAAFFSQALFYLQQAKNDKVYYGDFCKTLYSSLSHHGKVELREAWESQKKQSYRVERLLESLGKQNQRR